VSNVFPERLDSEVLPVQSDESLQLQSVPHALPVYNKYVGGVDCYNQVRISYGFDRKFTCYRVRQFFNFFFIIPLTRDVLF